MIDNGYLSDNQDLVDILEAIEKARSIGNSASSKPSRNETPAWTHPHDLVFCIENAKGTGSEKGSDR
jgi:hypothetical protein